MHRHSYRIFADTIERYPSIFTNTIATQPLISLHKFVYFTVEENISAKLPDAGKFTQLFSNQTSLFRMYFAVFLRFQRNSGKQFQKKHSAIPSPPYLPREIHKRSFSRTSTPTTNTPRSASDVRLRREQASRVLRTKRTSGATVLLFFPRDQQDR